MAILMKAYENIHRIWNVSVTILCNVAHYFPLHSNWLGTCHYTSCLLSSGERLLLKSQVRDILSSVRHRHCLNIPCCIEMIFGTVGIPRLLFIMCGIHNIHTEWPWENKTPILWYVRGKCPFGLIWPIGIYWRAILVRSRHISVRFYVCETTRCVSDVLLQSANWRKTFYNAYPVETGAVVMKFHVSLHTKHNIRGTSWGFTIIKSSRNKSRSD